LQEFGEAADGDDYQSIAQAALGYLVVLAKQQRAEMCAQLSQGMVTRLTSGPASTASDSPSCEGTLKLLLANAPASAFRHFRSVEVGAVRVDGDQAFVLVQDQGGDWFSIPMAEEDGTWKVGTLAPIPAPIAN
jgi:hypothetical protein